MPLQVGVHSISSSARRVLGNAGEACAEPELNELSASPVTQTIPESHALLLGQERRLGLVRGVFFGICGTGSVGGFRLERSQR